VPDAKGVAPEFPGLIGLKLPANFRSRDNPLSVRLSLLCYMAAKGFVDLVRDFAEFQRKIRTYAKVV
jgi:hypothetical protein